MKINIEKCEINKRRLVFDCDINDQNYRFEYDDWSFEDGTQVSGGHIITAYKHHLQAYMRTQNEECIFIDRQYKHNNSFQVYYDGVVYTVGDEEQPDLIGRKHNP